MLALKEEEKLRVSSHLNQERPKKSSAYNSNEPSSEKSSNPPATMTLAFPERMVSHAISIDWRAVALEDMGEPVG
jgi:uncharacterized membrane protein